MQPTITVGISYDGFYIEYGGKRINVNQEDDYEEKLREIFEHLGYYVEIEQDY
jgi:hypothetical protein